MSSFDLLEPMTIHRPSAAALRLLRLAAIATISLGCAHARYYDTISVSHRAMSRDAMTTTRTKLEERLKSDVFWLENAEGVRTRTTLQGMAPEGVQALWLATTAGDADAVEADRFVHTGAGYVPVTVRRGEAAWILRIGVAQATGPRGSGANLVERWGIGPLEADGATWTDEAREAVDVSLALLSVAERRVLAGIPIVRKHAPAGETGDGAKAVGARYSGRNCDARIFVFDAAFRGEHTNFAGEPEAPLHDNVRALVHEYGHAIHKRPARIGICFIDEELPRIQERQRSLNARVSAFNRTPSGSRSRAESDAIAQVRDTLEHDTASFEQRQRSAVEAVGADGPVLAAYAEVIGNDSPPTRYAQVSLGESFAESFSLFRADPAALQRLLPKVYEFFASGAHLRAMGGALEGN